MAGSQAGPPSGSGERPPSKDEIIAARLVDPNADLQTRLRAAQDLRDEVSRESYAGHIEYMRFLEVLLPAIQHVLSTSPTTQWVCAAEARQRITHDYVNASKAGASASAASQLHPHTADSLQNSIRHLLLEALQRFTHHDPFKPKVAELVQLLLKLMQVDNEDNAIIALKVVIDLHRSYKDVVGDTAVAFLDIVRGVYEVMPEVVAQTFGDEDGNGSAFDETADHPTVSSNADAPATPQNQAASGDGSTPAGQAATPTTATMPATGRSLMLAGNNADATALPPIRKIALGTRSLKLLAECPIAVVFLFQNYKDIVPNELRLFVPLVFQFLDLQAAPQRKAHADAQTSGSTYTGITVFLMHPERHAAFTDLIVAEIKTMSFVAYFIRTHMAALAQYRSPLPDLVVRLLKDCPSECASHRKELLIATRHILQTDFRNAFVAYIDTLVDDRVLIGFGQTAREQLRPLAYSMIADLIHHVREDLSLTTLAHVIHIYSCNVLDPTLALSIQTMCSKLLLNLTENVIKADSEEAGAILNRCIEAFTAKVEAVAALRDTWTSWLRPHNSPKPDGSTEMDEVDVERSKPIAAAAAMTDTSSDLVRDTRFLLRNVIWVLKTSIHGLKVVRAPLPNAPIVSRLFRAMTKCMKIFDIREDGVKERNEVMEAISAVLSAVEPLVFLEVIETNMPFFLDELIRNNELLAIPQALLADQTTSQLFVGICFRFLRDKLDKLGDGDAEYDAIVLRLFKMSFMAVTIFPELNEVVLQPHLAYIIMHSLKLASKATEPGCYYLLLRVLFRSIGGGRFELLYKEVIPLLEVLLTTLNGLLSAADRTKRDLFVELCLTVPVRLSVLLPFLNFLMKPLVLSLQAGPDLISQGLRTLELCVDNLTPEFLNPLMGPVQQELNAALWKLLRPVPFNHHHAHTTVRILGKIGGRNRKSLGPPLLSYKTVSDEATANLSFDGRPAAIPIATTVDLALRMIRRGDLHYRRTAYQVLKHASVTFLKDNLSPGSQESCFGDVLRGLFEACRIEEFQEDATSYLRNLAHYIFSGEKARQAVEESGSKSTFPLSSAFLDAIVETLATVPRTDIDRLSTQITDILTELIASEDDEAESRKDLNANLLHQLAIRLGSLCYDHSWQRKSGGALGISVVVQHPNADSDWLIQHEGEFVRALLFMLKDMPSDPPGNIGQITDTVEHILRLCNDKEKVPTHEEREKVQRYMVGFLIVELASQVETVRKTAQSALKVLAETIGTTITDLLQPVKNRLLNPIFTKPLRALAFPMQIGHMDAITYCMSLQPPLLELDGEKDKAEGAPPREIEVSLGRLLTEALGIADADDAALTGGKLPHHANSTQLTQLRIVCVRLLSAAMATAEFLAPKHNNMRAKILQVYFKLLYAKSTAVVEAAYECLRIPVQQGKLPKELLQNGLRPVLVNLGDHKRLTVDSLQSLARLLELLPNYFKVEIGQKLLDHYKALADPNTLPIAALAPQSENSEVNVMSAIINVFHLLPYPGSGTFLRDVCAAVVEVEQRLRRARHSPYTVPLAKYVSRYTETASTLFVTELTQEAWTNTLCDLLRCESGVPFRDYFAEKAVEFLTQCFSEPPEGTLATLNGARIIQAIVEVKPEWLKNNHDVVDMLLAYWTGEIRRNRLLAEGETHLRQVKEDEVFLTIFERYLSSSEHSKSGNDLLFRVCDAFVYRSLIDTGALSHFLFTHVAQSRDVSFRQAILRRFIDFMLMNGLATAHKTMVLRHLINPMLMVAFSRGEVDGSICDAEYLMNLHGRIWHPWLANEAATGMSDDSLRIEALNMATLIVRHRSLLMQDCRKDIIKIGWSYIKTADPTTKMAAHVLIAQFLAVYESKPKILMPIYTTLIRSHQVEARALVREALHILTPELPIRCPQLESGIHPWIRATRHIMVEDGHTNTSQLTHIYNLLIRFPDVFYERRDLFVPHIVSTLPKLCLMTTSTAETRALCIEVIELILYWDKQRQKIAKEEESGKMDVDVVEDSKSQPSPRRYPSLAPSTTSQSSSYQTYTTPTHMREGVVNGALIRFIASNPDVTAKNALVKKALDVLKHLFEVWPDVNIKFAFIYRVLGDSEISEQNMAMLCNTIEILAVVISFKTDDWVRSNIASLQRLIEKGMGHLDGRLHVLYKPIVLRIFSVLPNPVEREAPGQEHTKAFADWAADRINDGLRQMANLHSAITMMDAWASATPDAIDGFMSPLVRVTTSLTKELIANGEESPSYEIHLRLLRVCLEMFRTRMAVVGDSRRWILSALCTLVEKSSSIDLCKYILDVASQWVLVDHREAFPTHKEKATLLGKMMVFENRQDDKLLRDFLQIILQVYSDPQLARSEYTVRLEQPFLLGCRNRDAALRCRFMQVFDQAITRSVAGRLNYITGIQNWESLADTNWLHQALDLLMGAIDKNDQLLATGLPLPASPRRTQFGDELQKYTSGVFVDNARKLLYSDPDATHAVWVDHFKAAWFSLSTKEQGDTSRYFITLLTKDYHLQNVDRRPNVIQTLLAGALACAPQLSLPPHLVRYLGKTYNAYHTSIELLQSTSEEYRDETTIRDSSLDALAETYADLAEDDFLYGLWRRRAFFTETNVSISFEQAGLWSQAQAMYENAQLKARSGSLPFTEAEYSLWEDHWILCAQKLQHWDILTDLAKAEGNNDLLLECQWRLADWSEQYESIVDSIANMQQAPTPRKRVFEALAFLVKSQMGQPVNGQDFQRICDEGIQYSLRKWYHLPEIVSDAHIPLLHVFQQFVELQEAAKYIFVSLATTNAVNLDQRSQELKGTLQTWRDRLPNLWDDVNIWSDLVSWRQHVFQAINRAYLPLLPVKDGQPATGANSHAYRGYHETAWIINRFAHVARKHHLTDVCITSLTKIYTLPNIEIQEAFLKLREQAKCHYQNQAELPSGLEVINNTNLAYFNHMQKSEFYTLKGMFLARLGMQDEANQVFTQAVTMDMSFPKVWAEYGRYHDRLFKQEPNDLHRAANAVACYLQAAGLYKSGKVRKLLVRILWLLSLDDATGTVSKAFDSYTGELPVWYWITFSPQLIASLGSREARYARIILLQIAKKYPQGLFFHLRTAREELSTAQRAAAEAKAKADAAAAAAAAPAPPTAQAETPQSPATMNVDGKDGDASQAPSNGSASGQANGTGSQAAHTRNGSVGGDSASANGAASSLQQQGQRSALDYVEEISSVLKTAFPLLALSVELVCDQISARFKALPDEDIFRLVTALLQDGLQQYLNRAPNPDHDGQLSKETQANIARFAFSFPAHLKESFYEDFIATSPNLLQYVEKLQIWRDRCERVLDRKPKKHPLESLSHWLVEYKYQTFDEIEIPGQYLKHEDNNRQFVKISYFLPKVEVCRFAGSFTRRLTMVGYDGSQHSFAIQLPAPRSSRREEKLQQLFRMLNGPLQNRIESRKRGLQFHVPITVAIGQHCRLVETDSSITSMQDIYERYCTETSMSKDEPIMTYTRHLKEILRETRNHPNFVMAAAKLEVYIEIATKLFPDTILRDYFTRSSPSACELWHTRKQISLHLAAMYFQCYIFSVGRRLPTNILITRTSGQLHTSDLLPGFNSSKPEFHNNEPVPFRLTPNLQTFMTPIGIEGVLVSALMSIARCLTESEYDLEHRLSIFIADEMQAWHTSRKMPKPSETQLRDLTLQGVESIVRRAKLLSCKMEREKTPLGQTPVNQSVLDLITHATNPLRLAAMEVASLPWL